MTDRTESLDRFYELLATLDHACGGARRLAECSGGMGWPRRGVYFFFEPGERREDGKSSRVVRVGTHALRPSRSTLWGRLRQHKGAVGGSMPGGGNHRGSIFRLHVGAALLSSGDWPDGIRETWGVKGTTPRETRQAEYALEAAVTRYIGSLPFLWLAVDDEPSSNSERGVIERGAIALLSNSGRPPIDPPSPSWLGHQAQRAAIRESGLWNVEHINDLPDPQFLGCLDRLVDQMRLT